ncbi:unnamed protein product [Bathycoccus prasinos]|jgi:hypothetical protein
MASDDDDLGDLRAKIDRKAENAWFGKYRSFCVTFGTFGNLRNVVRVDDAGGVKNPTRNLKEEEKKESRLLKLFETPDFIDIFFGDHEKHDKGFAERGAKYDVLANERVGKGALLNQTDAILLACASEKIRKKLLENEKTKNFVKNAILFPFEMRNPIIAAQAWYAYKNSAVMINATERKKQKLTCDFCNALDRNPYDPTLLAFLVREANIDYVSRAQRVHAQETRGNLLRALTGGDPSTVQVVPSYTLSEQGYSDSEEEEAALEEWKELDAQIPVMTPEIWNTLPQEVRDQGLSMMNAINAMGLIDGFAGEAATQRAGTAAQTTTPATSAKKKETRLLAILRCVLFTLLDFSLAVPLFLTMCVISPVCYFLDRTRRYALSFVKHVWAICTKEKKKNAEKEQQKPKKKRDNPFRGMFDR